MKVLIDADGCPVTRIAVQLCKEYAVPCIILCDTAHDFHEDSIETLVFDKGSDSVDFAIVQKLKAGDIVITQDYGLASMCLTLGARVIHQDGWEYTAQNIDALLFQRHTSRKLRESGARLRGPSKRTVQHNKAFQQAFRKLLQTAVQG